MCGRELCKIVLPIIFSGHKPDLWTSRFEELQDHMSSFEGSSQISASIEELSPARAFKIVNRYLGWGDPGERGIWFVGIEEAEPWGNHEPEKHPEEMEINELDRARKKIKRFNDDTKGNWYSCITQDTPAKTPVFQYIAKIVCKFSATENDWTKYRKNHLFREGCRVFQANLFPLGKAKTTK